MNAPSNRLIIGLDYGTTFTGVAYQFVTYEKERANIHESTVISNWPGKAHKQAPSEISYSAAVGDNRQWGSDIHDGSQKMIWTKMELDQQGRKQELKSILDALGGMKNLDLDKIRMENGLPSYPAKEPVDIVADYLNKVRERVLEELGLHPTVLSGVITDLVVTVPAVWSEEAKNLTFQAVNKAGFTKQYFGGLRDIVFMTEPEAAALYSIKYFMAEEEDGEILGPGDCFVQADLGGGTADLISYCVEATAPDLQLRQIGLATSDRCGAIFVDLGFMEWLHQKLGDKDYLKLAQNLPRHDVGSHTTVGRDLKAVMEQFEYVKKPFEGHLGEDEGDIRLPGDLNNLHNPANGIKEGEVRITDDDLRRMFHFSINKITQLIQGQIGQVGRAGYRVRYIFLSGGFAESKYLFDEVREFGRQLNIKVKRPGDPQVAVVRGAVAKRLEQSAEDRVYMRKCSKSYGIVVSQPYSTYLHAEEDRYRDGFDNEWKAKEQMVWLLKKGELILSNEPKQASTRFCRRFGITDPREFITNLVIYNGDDAPQSLAGIPSALRTIVPIHYDLSDIQQSRFVSQRSGAQGNPYFTAYLKADACLDQQLSVSISCGNQELAAMDLEYEQEE